MASGVDDLTGSATLSSPASDSFNDNIHHRLPVFSELFRLMPHITWVNIQFFQEFPISKRDPLFIDRTDDAFSCNRTKFARFGKLHSSLLSAAYNGRRQRMLAASLETGCEE